MLAFVLHYAGAAHEDFRLPELLSLAELEGITLSRDDLERWEASPEVGSLDLVIPELEADRLILVNF
jgi:hypothetical protein